MGVRVGIAVGIGRGEKELALSPIQSKRWGMSTKRQKMVGTRFMAELRNVISDDFDGNMSELSRQSKVPSGTLGHYLSTHRYPRVDVLDRMLRCLGKESKARLLEAYLLDLTPPSARGQVVVRGSQDPALETQRLNEDLGFDRKLGECLEWMGRLAMENHAIRLMVTQTAKALGWKG
jgi:hypothetical protein